jgi:hypothetical protein
MKIRHGNKLDLTPLYMILRTPDWYQFSASFIRPANGRLARNIPKAIGSRRSGSNCFTIAMYNNTKEIRIITACCQVIAAKPD